MKLPYVDETELVMDLLRQGDEVTVAAPASLRAAVQRQAEGNLQMRYVDGAERPPTPRAGRPPTPHKRSD